MQQEMAQDRLTSMETLCKEELAKALDPSSCLALLRVCRATRDLVLSERDLVVNIILDSGVEGPTAVEARLWLACMRSSRVKLVLHGDIRRGTVQAARSLFMAFMERVPLQAITSVVLWDLSLDALVPPWLINNCPNMKRLKITWCFCDAFPHPVDAIPSVPQLKELHLDMHPNRNLQSAPWQHQLRALPNLSSLIISRNDCPRLVELCRVLGSQLTTLAVSGSFFPEPNAGPDPADPRHWVEGFECLCELHVPQKLLLDGDMVAIIGIETLRVVHCKGFTLQQSYTDRPCNWTELGFKELNVASFDRLPLLKDVKLVADVQECTIIPNADLAATERVVSMVHSRGGVRKCSELYLDCQHLQAHSAVLDAIMPMLSACQCDRLTVSHASPVTPELLAAMGQHLSSSMVPCIQFESCNWDREVWPLVLPSLPAGVDVLFSENVGLGGAEAITMCVNACRPVCVFLGERVDGRWSDRLEQVVQAAMANAGHQHVQLSFDQAYDPASDKEGDNSNDHNYESD